MNRDRDESSWRATLEARKVVKEHGITTLPVDPIALARSLNIEVMAKEASTEGISGMLLRVGNAFGIAYATHINNLGFQNFSVAHELGHYFLPGHIDAVLGDCDLHESHAGFRSNDRYEIEADHFAANLLMPTPLFTDAIDCAGEGFAAIESLAELCVTSLTATAIRYTQCTRDAMAIIVSAGDRVNYCFMSDTLKEVEGLEWIRKGEALPQDSATFRFNRDPYRVESANRTAGTSNLQDWFGSRFNIETTEEVIGLGSYGRTLTVLTPTDLPDFEEIQEEEEMMESWKPRFRR
ncbi:ImmA/IrrE family metallo-endopeptidase [Acidobacteria bacterium AH-259-O06]|nr:ImmA/IrrE family metallo-endopeptidase [Acidobacteria bacterium AH-259-O06]